MEKIKVMFDTNAFDSLLKYGVDINELKDVCEIYITHIQKDELSKIPDLEKLNSIANLVKEVNVDMLPTESAVFGFSKFGCCKYGDGVSYDKIRGLLDNIKNKPNNAADALIAETAIKNGLILITDDGHGFIRTSKNKDRGLYHICLDCGGEAMFFEDFIKTIQS